MITVMFYCEFSTKHHTMQFEWCIVTRRIQNHRAVKIGVLASTCTGTGACWHNMVSSAHHSVYGHGLLQKNLLLFSIQDSPVVAVYIPTERLCRSPLASGMSQWKTPVVVAPGLRLRLTVPTSPLFTVLVL